jgi:cobalt/nickel transport system permease protein
LKFLLAIATILAVSVQPEGAYLAIVTAWVVIHLSARIARIGSIRILRASFIALPFAAAALPLLVTRDGEAIGTVDFGLFRLTPTWEGLVAVTTILLKSWVSVQAATLLIFTTRFHDLLHGMERLGLPRLMVAIVSLMYRYLAVLVEEAQRMMRARSARSPQFPGRKRPGVAWQARMVGNMVGALFIRAYERSERVYVAMQARGYEGRIVATEVRALAPVEWAVLAVGLSCMAALALGGLLWLPRP